MFDKQDVTRAIHEVIALIESRLLPPTAPLRPRTILGSGDASIAETASGQSLAGAGLSIPPVHIPNAGDGPNARHSYKSELVLVRDPAVTTKKILWWYDKDPRDTPHNHPWDFRSAILSGGYTEERFWLSKGVLHKERLQHREGSINVVPADVFHNVVEVEPNTVTYLDCGPARAGNEWGYLTDTGVYVPFKDLTPKNFLETFRELNPHLRPKV